MKEFKELDKNYFIVFLFIHSKQDRTSLIWVSGDPGSVSRRMERIGKVKMGYNTHHSSQNCHKEDGGFYLILSTISLFCLKDIFVKKNQYSCNAIRDPFMDTVLRG